jgi:Hsp70 protein/putative pyrroloquinoline-quinone binding quinoprotein
MTAPSDGFLLGVDLGTSHTVGMLRRPDGRTRPLLFDGQPLLPSAVFRDGTGRLHVGRDALRLGYAEPDRFEPNPKRHIDEESVLLGGVDVAVADLLAALLGAVAREAVAAVGFLPPAVLTYPAGWGARRRDVLVTAITKAGWPRSTGLVPEPVAAARYFTDVLRRPVPVGAALAVFDFGAGTLDIAVVRDEGLSADGWPRFELVASGGADDLGGLDLDAALVDHLGKPLAGAEPEAWAALTEPVTLAQWRARRQFWEDVRGAKEMLSRSVTAPVPVPGVEHAVQLTRDELEAAIDPLIRRGVAEAAAVLKAAGLPVAELAGLFLVGGSSRVPMVARLLHSELGIAPIVLEQPELPVAEGAIVLVGVPAATPPDTGGLTSAAPHAGGQADGEPDRTALAEAAPPEFRPGVAAAATPTPTPRTRPGGAAAAPTPTPTTVPGGAAAAPTPTPTTRPGGAAAAPTPAPATVPGGAAAAPTPAPATVPAAPARRPGSAPVSPAPHYAEPVDPWATAEAAALAAQANVPAAGPWLASRQPDPEAPPERGAVSRRLFGGPYKKVLWGLMVVVLGVAATLVVVLWPGHRALDFRPLSDAVRLPPAVPVSSAFADAEVLGDRAYFASADDTGALGVVAADTGDGKRLWASTAAGVAPRWANMVALPTGVAIFTDTDSTSGTRRMVVLNAKDGKLRWERVLDDDDEVFFVGSIAVLADRTGHRLLGLKLDDRGQTAWTLPDLKTDSGTAPAIVPATTPDDVSGPAGVQGRVLAGEPGDDTRIVQLGSDHSARVIDAADGKVLVKPRQSVAAPNDEVIAHNGRLIVRESADAHRIVSYDLAKLGEPKVLYTAADTNRQLTKLVPCGDDRACFIETAGYDAKSAHVVSVDVAKGGHWSRLVPNVEGLVPVGDSVLAARNTSPDKVSLLDPDGKISWTRDGEAARLNAGNVLLFSKALSTSPDDPALAGQHLGDSAVPLGALSDVRSASCSWNTSVLACAAEKDFVLQRFTG